MGDVLLMEHTGAYAFFMPTSQCTDEFAALLVEEQREIFERMRDLGRPRDGEVLFWLVPEADCAEFTAKIKDVARADVPPVRDEVFPKSARLVGQLEFYGSSRDMFVELFGVAVGAL